MFLFLGLISSNGFSQTDEVVNPKTDYLIVQTGFIVDRYNSVGVRTFFEYKKDIKKNWQFGISYEHSRHFANFRTGAVYNLESNLSLISINGYYKLNLLRDRLFWTGGIGVGALHVNWDDNDAFGATVNASLTLGIRVTRRIYFVSSPLLIFMPTNRIYYSPLDIGRINNFYAFTSFPFGIKVGLR